QIPIGVEHDHQGVVDLIRMKGYLFEGESGEEIKEIPIPANLQAEAEARREQLLDVVSMHHDELMEAMLEDRVTEEMIRTAVRKATIARAITPVFMGSAYKNKGVQLLLDAVVDYLPAPNEVTNQAIRIVDDREEAFDVRVVPDAPLLSLAFKLEVSPYGQLTYLRVYQGSLAKGDFIVNQRSREKVKVGRLVRMHADSMEDIEATSA